MKSMISRFTFLMKGEPIGKQKAKTIWAIDESKYLAEIEVKQLRAVTTKIRSYGVRSEHLPAVRHWFMIELGLGAGLRVAEMASLCHGDFLVGNGRSSIRVIGKGQKKRSVWIGSELRGHYQDFKGFLIRCGLLDGDDDPVLPNRSGAFISKRSLQKSFKQISSEAGLPLHYSIHCLRHTYATFLLKVSNYNYRFVQKQLGHASIRTTQVYAGVVESEVRQALEELYR